jgi:hypothetical protein
MMDEAGLVSAITFHTSDVIKNDRLYQSLFGAPPRLLPLGNPARDTNRVGGVRLASTISAVIALPPTPADSHEGQMRRYGILLWCRGQLRRLARHNHPRGIAIIHEHTLTAGTWAGGGCHRA